jgi:hypothetical protein
VKRLRVLLIAGACAIALVVALLWPRQREPEYQGKQLREWLGPFSAVNSGTDEDVARFAAAVHALRHTGTNALPCLLDWIDDHSRRERFQELEQKFVNRLPGPLHTIGGSLIGRPQGYYYNLGFFAFRTLGPVAAQAVPELTHRLNSKTSHDARARALLALCDIGKEGLPAVLSVLTNKTTESDLRSYAAEGIAMIGSNAVPAFPYLAQCLKEEDSKLVYWCSLSLSVIPVELDDSQIRLLDMTGVALIASGRMAFDLRNFEADRFRAHELLQRRLALSIADSGWMHW